MASLEGQLAYLAVTPWALLEPTVTEPSVKLQDEAALATLVRRIRDDAIEKRMILTLSQVDSVGSGVEAKWMRQDSSRQMAHRSLHYVVAVESFDWSKLQLWWGLEESSWLQGRSTICIT